MADWVVIVIKSSCTASESTKLSTNGWSTVGGWAVEGSRSLSPPRRQCLCQVGFFFILFFYMASVYVSQNIVSAYRIVFDSLLTWMTKNETWCSRCFPLMVSSHGSIFLCFSIIGGHGLELCLKPVGSKLSPLLCPPC